MVAIRDKAKEMSILATAQDFLSGQIRVRWIDANPAGLSGKIVAMPQRSDIQLPVNEQQIVELYSK